MASSLRGKTRHRWLTQNRTGVRRDEICMAHPIAGVAMTFQNTLLNECLRSVKKIYQWVRFWEGSREKKSVFHCDRNQSVQREKQEVFGRRGDWILCVCVRACLYWLIKCDSSMISWKGSLVLWGTIDHCDHTGNRCVDVRCFFFIKWE